ncbi:MAG: hypothetical protein ACJ750_09825 [Gaiellaceae bacterium]
MKRGRLGFERLAGDELGSWLVLAGVMVFAFVVRTEQARRLPTPLLLCDEFIYADIAKSFADEGRLLFRGEPLRLSLLYPVLLAPAWLAERMATTYAVAKTINVALMTASVVPLYLLGRRLLTPGWALLPPVLTLLLPMTLLSSLLMTESAFMPAFLLAVYAIAIALESPTLARQAFALAAIALATVVRFQGAVLVGVFVTALLLVVIFDLRATRPDARARFTLERLRPYWPTAAAFAAVAVAFVALEAVRGGAWAYEEVARAEYSPREAWRMTRVHLAALALTSGLVPLSALILLSWRAFTGASRGAPERAFLAVTLAAVVGLLVQAGLFTSRFSPGLLGERYVFYVIPLLFLALAVWLAQGLTRPRIATAVAAALPGAIVVLEPVMRAVNPLNLGLFAFHGFARSLGKDVDDLVWLVRLGIVVAAVAFGLLSRPIARIAIPLGLCAFLALSSHSVREAFRPTAALMIQDAALQPNPQWISDTVGDADVGYLFTGDSDVFGSSRTMLSVNFWNPPVRSVIHVGPRELCQLPSREARIDPRTGRISASDGRGLPRHLVAPVGRDLAGVAVARQGPLILYRTIEPVSLLQSTEGVYSDTWMGRDSAYTRYYGPVPGQATVALSREHFTADAVPSQVRIAAGPVVLDEDGKPAVGRPQIRRRSTLKPGERKVFTLPAPTVPFRISVRIEPTFSAAGFGGGDQRRLSALVQFGFTPTSAEDSD